MNEWLKRPHSISFNPFPRMHFDIAYDTTWIEIGLGIQIGLPNERISGYIIAEIDIVYLTFTFGVWRGWGE